MEVQGKIKSIGKSEFIGSNGFEKREIVLTTEEQYPQDILIQFTQGRCWIIYTLGKQSKYTLTYKGVNG